MKILFLILLFTTPLLLLVSWMLLPRSTATHFIYSPPNLASIEPTHKNKLSRFSVMTYNIAFSAGLKNLKGKAPSSLYIQDNLNKIIETVKRYKPDFLAVQEIDIRSNRSYNIDQVAWIAEQAGFPYVAVAITWNKKWIPYPLHQPIHKQFGGILAGQAFFSRHPILSQDVYTLPKPKETSWLYNRFYINRQFQFITINMHGTPITFGHVHFEAFHKKTRQLQVKHILHTLDQQNTMPDILLGDFNAISPDLKQAHFPDEPEVDYGDDMSLPLLFKTYKASLPNTNYTFPADTPNRKLDYVLYRKTKLLLNSSRVLSSTTSDTSPPPSDHLPILSVFSRPL